jgi:N-acetyl-alpha-D-muramate 1-phosphate uridylyltransferase
MPEALMLFAAGFGKRMLPLTADLPKPMIPVAGKPLIDHALALADAMPLLRKVVNLHYLPDPITRHLQNRNDLVLLTESPRILETGGGLRNALPHLGPGPVFTLNTDAVWSGPNPLQVLADHWDADRMDVLVLLVPAAQALGHPGTGDFALDAQGRISRAPGDVLDWIYVGTQIIRTEGLADVAERAFSLNLMWDRMIATGRAYGVAYAGQWCDVGRPEGIAVAETMLKAATHV